MGNVLIRGKNDLQTVRPDLAKEWHPTKNGRLTPCDVPVYGAAKVWWQIEATRFGRTFTLEWQATVRNRASGAGCPFTSIPPKRLMKGFNDLATTNPAVAALWHPTKNAPVFPDMIFENTNQKYWWSHTVERYETSFCHEWEATPGSLKAGSCPICHGTQILRGFNDLASVSPSLAAQWDQAANGALLPSQVTAGSNKRVHWVCDACGNRWVATVNNRSHGSGCPDCASRYATSFPEQALYYYLKKRFPDARNRDTTALDGVELDILLPKERIAIEYDGQWSHRTKEKQRVDVQKQRLCREMGILFIRVCEGGEGNRHLPREHLIRCTANAKHTHLAYVMDCICRELAAAGSLDSPLMIDIERDRQEIYAQYQRFVKERSLGARFPELLSQWDDERNGGLSPFAVFAGSNMKVHWTHRMARGGTEFVHTWIRAVNGRTGRGSGCPVCNGKQVQAGFNDLQTAAPEFLCEWDHERNLPLRPDAVTARSKKKVWWKHTVRINGRACEHIWLASVGARMSGNGCPICDGKTILPGFNDLASTHPALLSEWDYEKNQRLPTEIPYGYDKKVWWKHTLWIDGKRAVHSWQASPNSRTNRRSGCPYCCTNKRALAGFNDLASSFPQLAEKWDVEKNAPLLPDQVTPASGKKVWWTDRARPIRICDRTKYLREKRKGPGPA